MIFQISYKKPAYQNLHIRVAILNRDIFGYFYVKMKESPVGIVLKYIYMFNIIKIYNKDMYINIQDVPKIPFKEF
jgi:hypothetical protein